jgi:hypothetical protein
MVDISFNVGSLVRTAVTRESKVFMAEDGGTFLLQNQITQPYNPENHILQVT